MSKAYEVNGGQVLRNGELIANYDEASGSLDFLPDMARFRAPVVEFLRSKGLNVASGSVTKKSGVPSQPEKPDSGPSGASQNDPEGSGDTVTVSKAELAAMKAKLAELTAARTQSDAVSENIQRKVVFCPPQDKIFDPEVGHIRG